MAGGVVIKIHIKNLPQIRRAFKLAPALMAKNLDSAIRKTVFYIRARAVSNAPVRTGFLRGSAYSTFGNLRGETGFKAKYAAWVHEGTSPYTIRPKSKKALFWKGAGHPVAMVSHPGIRANPFMRRAINDSQNQVDGFFTGAVQDTLDTIAKEAG